jgi:acetylornithine deacetylase/succinyl-diaminopimelate desuccinylase-like protein
LVANQTPERVLECVKAALHERCPKGVQLKVTDGDGGVPYLVVPPGRPNTPGDQPKRLAQAFESAGAAVEAAFGVPALYLREGGSVPIIGQIKAATGLDTVMIGLFLPEDNLHAPDESMSVEMIDRGVACYRELFERLAQKA